VADSDVNGSPHADVWASAVAAFAVIEYEPPTGVVTLVRNDGNLTKEQVTGPLPGTPIVRSTWRPPDQLMQIELDDGAVFDWHLDSPSIGRDRRPIVYVDQNHWVYLSQARIGSPKLTGARLHAYQRFLESAGDQAIIVPLSSGHFVELGRKSGQQRRDVAVTMLQVSRGWVMRNPLRVRAEELRRLFDAESPVGEVFSLDPSPLFSDTEADGDPGPLAPVGSVEATAASHSLVMAMVDVLSNTGQIQSAEGILRGKAWADGFTRLAVHMGGNPKAKAHRRAVTRMKFIGDVRLEFATAAQAAGATHEEFEALIMDESETKLMGQPALGRYREVIHRRLSNPSDTWEPNDLYDLLFLSTAAGYGDVVVAERKMGNYLRQCEVAVTAGAQVFVTMADAVEAIEARLADR
jgi:hypothetical protein